MNKSTKSIIYQWNKLDRIFKALQIYNNGYYSEEMREEAFEVLQEEFADQLQEAWEIDALERGYEESELESMRWWQDWCQVQNDILLNALTYYEPQKWK